MNLVLWTSRLIRSATCGPEEDEIKGLSFIGHCHGGVCHHWTAGGSTISDGEFPSPFATGSEMMLDDRAKINSP